jgi:hypothetical protein
MRAGSAKGADSVSEAFFTFGRASLKLIALKADHREFAGHKDTSTDR